MSMAEGPHKNHFLGEPLASKVKRRKSHELLKAKKIRVLDIEVTSHSTLHSSEGVVICKDSFNCAKEENVEELHEQGVVVCSQLNIQCNREVLPSVSHMLTFNKPKCSEKIKARFHRFHLPPKLIMFPDDKNKISFSPNLKMLHPIQIGILLESLSNSEVMIVLSFLLVSVLCYDDPVIGLLTQELPESFQQAFPNYTSYVAASYVKAIEGSGGRVVPIFIGQNESYYRKQVSVLNGIVIPGGTAKFSDKNGYAEAGTYIFNLAVQANQQGDHFPIYGVCLGFELLLHLGNNGKELRTSCKCESIGLPLKFLPGFRQSRLYGNANVEILTIISSTSVTSNHHVFCITPQNMSTTGLKNEWKTLSLNTDENGLIFVSSVESIIYPFAGTQFHPEKNAYEWEKSQNNPHSRNAILSARHFYDWIVNEASKSEHSFESELEKNNALIGNYPKFFSGKQGLYFEEIYLFK
ncbi:gamma-glutamyl hydrolase-like [Lycorma delicatula]|uniref:gamma-glutamyl hydrolase-like n=1 Tax=Lycorma delicatula TaxID=130591 RepID=UPI003F51AA4D